MITSVSGRFKRNKLDGAGPMENIGRTRIRFLTIGLIIGFPLGGPPCALAQSPLKDQNFDWTTSPSRSNTAHDDGISPVTVTSKDASGALDSELFLDINIVQIRNVSLESIRILGIPKDVVVSDYRNTFISAADDTDADVTSWDISKLHVMQNGRRDNSFPLAVAVIWSPYPGGQIDMASTILHVRFVGSANMTDSMISKSNVADNNTVQQIKGDSSTRPSADVSAIAPKAAATETPAKQQPGKPSNIDREKNPPVAVNAGARPGAGLEASPPRQSAIRSPTRTDPLVERAKNLIQIGDISGARLLLERARARNAPNAVFLLAQTWDPDRLRAWKVRGMQADPGLARSLYAKAAEQGQTDEQLLAATRP